MRTFILTVNGALISLSVLLFPSGIEAQSAAIFRNNRACHSPHGNVPEGCRANSSDESKYAQEVKPPKHGNIGVFQQKDGQRLKLIKIEEVDNPLKGIAWDPKSRQLAVMYHHDEDPSTPRACAHCGYVYIVETQSGNTLKQIPINKWYRFLAFSDEGTLSLSTDGQNIETVDLSKY